MFFRELVLKFGDKKTFTAHSMECSCKGRLHQSLNMTQVPTYKSYFFAPLFNEKDSVINITYLLVFYTKKNEKKRGFM